jgi:hypothetical protein
MKKKFVCRCADCPRRASGLMPGETPCHALASAWRTAARARAELDEYLLTSTAAQTLPGEPAAGRQVHPRQHAGRVRA